MAFSTLAQSARYAMQLAEKNAEDYYIVFENGEYHVASDYDLETYFCGSVPIGYAGYGLGFEQL
jgi:hypothetical protein